jgi:hypothetical protein
VGSGHHSDLLGGADRAVTGWVHNLAQCQWELRNDDGYAVVSLSDEVLYFYAGNAAVAAHIRQRLGSVPPPMAELMAAADRKAVERKVWLPGE